MRPTDQIDDPTWKDIHDRDAEIARLKARLTPPAGGSPGESAYYAYCNAVRAAGLKDAPWTDLLPKIRFAWETVAETLLATYRLEDEAQPATIQGWQRVIHEYAKDKGWWDKPVNVAAKVMLMATEVHEAFDEWRNNHPLTEVYYEGGRPMKPEGVPVELADVVIRVLDFCEWAGIDMQAVMTEKHAYNLTRAYRHGGKRV